MRPCLTHQIQAHNMHEVAPIYNVGPANANRDDWTVDSCRHIAVVDELANHTVETVTLRGPSTLDARKPGRRTVPSLVCLPGQECRDGGDSASEVDQVAWTVRMPVEDSPTPTWKSEHNRPNIGQERTDWWEVC